MNGRQLEKIGVPRACRNAAITAVQKMAKAGRDASRGVKGSEIKQRIKMVLEAPESFLTDDCLAEFAQAIIEDRQLPFQELNVPRFPSIGRLVLEPRRLIASASAR